MKKQIPVILAFVTALLLNNACVSITEKDISVDSPVELFPMAAKLKEAPSENLFVSSPQTISTGLIHARTFQQVAEKSSPAVVSIYVKTKVPVKIRLIPIKFRFAGIPAMLPGVGLGSGFFIHPDGYILTNEHVIRNADDIRVMTQTGVDYVAKVVAEDPVYDLAVLKVTAPDTPAFNFLRMGASEELKGGDHVIAIGNPLGFGQTVTAGVVGFNGRSLFEESNPEGRYVKYLQTDAAINHGSSGGPLITLTGAWVGVNTATINKSQGIGFAVPSIQVNEFLQSILNGDGVQIEEDE